MPKRRNIAEELGLHLPLPPQAQAIYDRSKAAAKKIKRDRMPQPIVCPCWTIGIDPGINPKSPGAIAFVNPAGRSTVFDNPRVGDLPDFDAMWQMLRAYRGKNIRACVEQQWARPNDSAHTMSILGPSYGGWMAFLTALEIPYQIVSPQKWKRSLGLAYGGGKEDSIDLCKHVDPGVDLKFQKYHGRAEARLIAEYLRRTIANG